MPDIPNIIRNPEFLPRIFDPRKYKALNDLELADWAHVVSQRYHRRQQLLEALSDKNQLTREKLLEKIKLDIQTLLKTPLPPQSRKRMGNYPVTKGFSVAPEQASRDTPSLRMLSMFDLLSLSHDKRRYGAAIEAYEQYADGNAVTPGQRKSLNKPVFYAGRDPICDSRPRIAPIAIDLSASDQVLAEDFKNWLAITRKDIARREGGKKDPRHHDPADIEALRRAGRRGAVAYIDLESWAMTEGARITSNVFSEALNGGGFAFCPRATVRDAEWLLQSATNEILQAYCQHRSDQY